MKYSFVQQESDLWPPCLNMGELPQMSWRSKRSLTTYHSTIKPILCKETSSPKGYDCSPESNVQNSNSAKIYGMSSLPAWIKRIGSKTTEKRWRHHFPHYKSMGGFCCHGNQSCDPICPKTLWGLSPTPMMLNIKFNQDWPTGFRDIQVKKVWNFCHSRANNSKMSGLIQPKIEIDQAFMPVLVTSNFDDDSIKNEWASMETPFSHY